MTLRNFPNRVRRRRLPQPRHRNPCLQRALLRPLHPSLRLLHLRPVSTFDELTGNPEWAKELHRVYDGDVERVDVTVGMYAERLPRGFAFSDTAFRVFILMASRRLNSDRFFTEYYTPAVYSQTGLDWISETRWPPFSCATTPAAERDGAVDNAFARGQPLAPTDSNT